MTKSRLSRKEIADLLTARSIAMSMRAEADAGNKNAIKLVAKARETIARLTAKRDNKIWL